MPVSSSCVNMHNSYSSTYMSRWSNHNAYVTEHVSNIHNQYVPPYSSTELASHCTPQTHMTMSNCNSWADMRVLSDFGPSLYTAPDSIRVEIATNMASAPLIESNTFHSASLVYGWVEESLANTPTPGTNRYDSIRALTQSLPSRNCQWNIRMELEVQQQKMVEAFMTHYDLMN
jgi:hypothetical protein